MSNDHTEKYITSDPADDGIDRRGFLKCMAWTGTGLLWTLKRGIPTSVALSRLGALDDTARKEIFFAQISDSHIGFSKPANTDVTGTLQQAVDRLNLLPRAPAFVLHTGDISQLSKADEFDTADQVLKGIRTDRIFFVPGEHDVLSDNGGSYLKRYGAHTTGAGWYSFDHTGVHFIGLVNVLNLRAGGLGSLGPEQLDWLRRDVRGLANSTPIVLFAHIPLWTVYPEWGWGTDDSEQALALLKRFGSLTVLNGHIHQVMQKVEGHVSFHTAMSTAFPQPAPGSAPSPGPLKVDADRLASVLGTTSVTYVPGRHGLAVVDATLSGAPVMATMDHGGVMEKAHASTQRAVPLGPSEVGIDNFIFTPGVLTVKAGTPVTWTNRDDVPHIIVDARGKFSSRVLDTDQRFTLKLTVPGTYDYFCSIHPKMTGRIVVE